MKKIFASVFIIFTFTVSSFAASRKEVKAFMSKAKSYNYRSILVQVPKIVDETFSKGASITYGKTAMLIKGKSSQALVPYKSIIYLAVSKRSYLMIYVR